MFFFISIKYKITCRAWHESIIQMMYWKNTCDPFGHKIHQWIIPYNIPTWIISTPEKKHQKLFFISLSLSWYQTKKKNNLFSRETLARVCVFFFSTIILFFFYNESNGRINIYLILNNNFLSNFPDGPESKKFCNCNFHKRTKISTNFWKNLIILCNFFFFLLLI